MCICLLYPACQSIGQFDIEFRQRITMAFASPVDEGLLGVKIFEYLVGSGCSPTEKCSPIEKHGFLLLGQVPVHAQESEPNGWPQLPFGSLHARSQSPTRSGAPHRLEPALSVHIGGDRGG